MKRWDMEKGEAVEMPAVDAFLAEVIDVCRRHGMSLGTKIAKAHFKSTGRHDRRPSRGSGPRMPHGGTTNVRREWTTRRRKAEEANDDLHRG